MKPTTQTELAIATGVAATVATPASVAARLSETGYAFLTAAQLGSALHLNVAVLDGLRVWWDTLPQDRYLRDGGSYRSRRHSCFIQDLPRNRAPDSNGALTDTPRRAHWQPTSYNALHGGMERWFDPIAPEVSGSPGWQTLLMALGALFARLRPVARWFVEAHQFRIDTQGGIGRPTPEGAHRDGVDFVALILIRRQEVRGGETRVFEANGIAGVRFTMSEPWSALLMDDERVIHETTPIQPEAGQGVRDTLVLSYRAGGFQSPAAT